MLIFYYYFRFKVRIVKPINHGAKILSLRRPNENADWFWGKLGRAGYMIWFIWAMSLCLMIWSI